MRHMRIFAAAVVLGFVIGSVPTAAPAQGSVGGKIYWTDSNNGGTAAAKVSRSNLVGFSPEALVPPPGDPGPIAPGARFMGLDPVGGKVYWIDGGTIRRADMNGGPEEAFLAGLPGPVGIAINTTARHIYWSDIAARTISRANLDGTGVPVTLVVSGQPRALALDVAAGGIYWAEQVTATSFMIQRANLELDDASRATVILASGSNVEGIALDLDPSGGNVYWADIGAVNGVLVGRIRRANLVGVSEVQPLVVIPGNGMLVSPKGVAIDTVGGKAYWAVFWVDATGTPTEGRIQRANLDGTVVEDVVAGLDTPWGIAIANLDSTPPDTSISSGPAEGSLTNSTQATFAFTGTDDQTAPSLLRFACSLDGGSFVPCASPHMYSGLPEGRHTFMVQAIDEAGNVDPTPAASTWTVDITPPAIFLSVTPQILWPPNHQLVQVSVTVSASDQNGPASIVLSNASCGETDHGACAADDIQGADVGTLDTDLLLRATRSGGSVRTYTLTYQATDLAGNTGTGNVTVTVPANSQ